jgi:hypothetical protein
LWDDGADPTAELNRMMTVRAAAIAHFGLSALAPGEPMANLRRRFVPIWLLHRYEVVAAGKAIGGGTFGYAINGGGHEESLPVPADAQRAALSALLATLTTDALHVPPRLVPLLSQPRNGSDNRQFDIEVFQTAHGPLFDPLVAADASAQITLNTLLAPARLARVSAQHAVDPNMLSVREILDALWSEVRPQGDDALSHRIAYRSIVTMAATAQDKATTPEVAARIDSKLNDIAGQLSGAWGNSLARKLRDPHQRALLAKDMPRSVPIPPADPIGGGEGDWMDMP